jgi:hypothetical protein
LEDKSVDRLGSPIPTYGFGELAAEKSAPFPLSFTQQQLWFMSQLVRDGALYNLTRAVRFRGPLDVPALTRSVNEIVRRHESLRTTFTAFDGMPAQVIAPTLGCPSAARGHDDCP